MAGLKMCTEKLIRLLKRIRFSKKVRLKAPWQICKYADTDFEKFYFLSSEFDDPRALDNCASAESLLKHGGFQTKRMSNGQRTLAMLSMWLKENENEWDDKTLLIFDEADKGMDLKYQVGFMRMLDNLNKKRGVKSLAVSHHSLPLLLADKLYWFESRTSVPSQVYLSIMTGYEFTPPKRIEDE